MRKILIVTHRWVALTVGIVLLCVAGSGAVLVFENAIDRALNPRLWRVTPTNATLPLDTLGARVEAKFPAAKVGSITMFPGAERAWTVGAGPLTVFIDPHTGAITGTRTPEQARNAFARRMHVFHVELFAGKVGRSIVGAVCVIALFLVITGIILWWPDKLIRINPRTSWKRINFDLHHALGIAAALILVVITASGMVIHYDALAKLIQSLDTSPPARVPAQPAGSGDAPRPSFDAIAAAARAALPGASLTVISVGGPGNFPVAVALRFPEDRTPAGRSRVYLDRYSGAVLAAVSTREAQLGTRIDNLKRSLHTGDVLGGVTRYLWFAATLVLVSQVVTGVLMWWNARRARRKRRA